MKIKEGFMLRKVDDTYLVVAVGSATINFNGIITLNESGAFLWNKLTQNITEQDLISAFAKKYEIDNTKAEADIKEFISKIEGAGIVA